MNPGPLLEQLGAPLRLLLVRDQPATIDVTLVLPPEATALTDADIIIENPDVPTPAVFVDDAAPHFQISWTAEQAETAPLSACRYAIVIALDGAPLRVLYAGSLSWVDQWTPGASTSMSVTSTVNFGDLALTATIVFGGPQGPPGGGGGGGVTSVNGDEGPDVLLVASEVPATPGEGLSGPNVQAQLGQADGLFEQLATDLSALQDGVELGLAGKVSSIVAGTNVTVNATDPQNPVISASGGGGGGVTSVNGDVGPAVNLVASEIPFTPSGTIAATDVQAAVIEAVTEASLNLAAHIGTATDAHDATAVSFVPSGSIAATNAQTAIQEVASDAAIALVDHIADAVDAHDASAISFVPSGGIGATNVQSAVEEVVTDLVAFGAATYDPIGAAAAAQAFAIQRANHTGTQAISTVTGLQAALDGKADDSEITAINAALATKFTTPTPLEPKMVFGTTLETAVAGLVGYDDAASPMTLAFRGFTGALKATAAAEDDDLVNRAFGDGRYIRSSNDTVNDEQVLTSAAYAALPTKDPNTVYFLVG